MTDRPQTLLPPRYCNICGRKKDLKGYTCGACGRTMRRWSTNYKVVTLAHIAATARKLNYFYPSKKLQQGLLYFTNRYNLLMPYSLSHTARVLLVASVFASRGWLEYGPSYLTYLLYLMGGYEAQNKYRDSSKKRLALMQDKFTNFTYQYDDAPTRLFGTLLLEAQDMEKFIQDNSIEITMQYKKTS